MHRIGVPDCGLNSVMSYEKTLAVLAVLTGMFLQAGALAAPVASFSEFQVKKAGFYPELVKRFGKKHAYSAEEVLSLEQPKPLSFKAVEVQTHFDVIGKLDPKKAHLYQQLIQRFGKKPTYSADEVTAVEVPREPTNQILSYRPSSTVDTFSAEVVRQHFALLRTSNPKSKASMEAIEKK